MDRQLRPDWVLEKREKPFLSEFTGKMPDDLSASCKQDLPCSTELDALCGRWMEAMQQGDYEAAWVETDRVEIPRRAAERVGTFTPTPHHLLWNGTSFDGRRVLIRCEHGLGDTIQYLRYCPLLESLASSVTVKVQPPLLSIFTGMGGIHTLLNAWTSAPEPEHDVAIECMELAYAFRHTAETIPARVPYLPVEHIHSLARAALPLPHDGTKIGLVWAASEWDSRRSIPLRALAPLGSLKGAQFFSLQQGGEQRQLTETPFPIVALSEYTVEIVEVAAAMLALDLIITIDSMTAHLAGALGRPVWLLLTYKADWRWQREGSHSPWYPTMRLFRQPQPGNWKDVAEHVADAIHLFSSIK